MLTVLANITEQLKYDLEQVARFDEPSADAALVLGVISLLLAAILSLTIRKTK